MNLTEINARLNAYQDDAADIALLKDAISFNSITGNETPFARFIESHLKTLDLDTHRSEFKRGRENIWGSTRGTNTDSSLMFVGHSDVVHTQGWSEHWQDDPRADAFAAIEKDGFIWGRGSTDLKGGICAAIAALRLLKKSGYELKGKLSVAVVGDEESGETGTGVSAGAKDLAARVKTGEIDKPEFTIYVEPTNLAIYTAQIGFFIAEITITGKTA